MNAATKLLIPLLAALAACQGADEAFDPGDVDSDSDSDADASADTDSDTDGDTDSQSDSGEDTDTNTYGLEDWDIYITVDNQFEIYFGTVDTIDDFVGDGADWTVEFHFTAEDMDHSDFLYVATSSDQLVAQGFIGTFTNITLGKITNSGEEHWQVFGAGGHEETNPYWPSPWPASLMPTQEEVLAAIQFATANDLWVTAVGYPGYDNDPDTPIDPYTFCWTNSVTYDFISPEAAWIWYESGAYYSNSQLPSPFAGYDHDEFLVFRVAGAVVVVE